MISSPARILQQWLVDQGIGVDAGLPGDFPIYVGFLGDQEDKALAVYDTSPVTEGRIQRTGETIEHPGLQFRVRHNDYAAAYDKAKQITNALDGLKRATVVVDTEAYTVHGVHHRGIIDVGPEDDKRRRQNFTINALATIGPFLVDLVDDGGNSIIDDGGAVIRVV